MSISRRLSKTFQSTKETIPLGDSTKMVFFSDCHRGTGNWEDDFSHNQNVFFHALNYYYENGFTYVEVGDGDELWENKNFSDIADTHSHIYWKLGEFHKEGRFYLMWGNHNRDWSNSGKVKKYLDPRFPGIRTHEALRLGDCIFIVHGHQGQVLNDQLWWVGRFIVRNIWKVLQRFTGAHDPTSPAKNFKTRNKVETGITNWAKGRKQLVIAGHTHRSVFPALSSKDEDPHYFNAGSCVHPRCITGIEIQNGVIVLIKWHVDVKKDGTLFINRKELEPPEKLQDYLDLIS